MPGVRAAEQIVTAIVSYLETAHPDEPGVPELLDRLGSASVVTDEPPVPPRHDTELALALAQLCQTADPQLAKIGDAITGATGSLPWRVDDGQYYKPDAPVGDGYRNGNMHVVLADGDDFSMGLFLLVPRVDYLDHHHRAPEFYLNLTGPCTWRFDFGDWLELTAGSVVWNDSGRVHATKSGRLPWLSVWAWLRDIDHPCEVVSPPDDRAG
jgi:quercetin dioxygenase-like cupin family protein